MKKIRLTALTMAGLMAAASMTGCGAKTAETTAASETTTAAGTMAAETTTVAETAGKVSQTKPLVVYLNDFDDIIPEMFKKATGYDVEVVAGNGAETLARIETEGDNPQWDIVWLDSMPSINSLGKKGMLLTDWEPSNAGNLTDFFKEIVPADKAYYPTGAHAAGVIAYRNDVFTEETAPKAWEDFAKPEYKDKIGIADPSVAAPGISLRVILLQLEGNGQRKRVLRLIVRKWLKGLPKESAGGSGACQR